MKYDWAIWKPAGNDGNVRFVHESDLPNSGFASVYRFTEADARAMQTLGSFEQFKGTVHSGQLKIDADTEAASEACEGRLKALGAAFDKFTTGNRGHHYHVVRSSAPSHTLPTADKLFVKREFPGVDLSFYHHVGLYRQTGAVHAKTGRRKKLLYSHPGLPLIIEGAVPRELKAALPEVSGASSSVFEDPILTRMTVPVEKGNRHKHYIEIAIRMDVLKQRPEFAVEYIRNVDLMSGGETPYDDMVRIVEWAYYQRAK